MIEINLYNEYNEKYYYLQDDYEQIAKIALEVLNINNKDYEISVTLVDNTRIHEINLQYRDKDYATDVISFESGMLADDYLPEIDLGDIFISIDKAIAQSKEYGHSEERELNFLFTHGLLHCLGYDHLNPEDEKEMFALQEVILNAYKHKQEN